MNKKDIKEIINNLIVKAGTTLKNIPKKVKIISVLILILIILCYFIFVWITESQKQKYVEYDGENLKESKYPGY